jgi:hypothetical protein
MPGTPAHDALAPTLLNGTISTTANGSAVEVNRPGITRMRLVNTTISGTSPTLDVEVEASDVSDFSSGVVSLGKFDTVSSANQERYLTVDVRKRYVRAAHTVGGTSPSFAGVKLTMEERRYDWAETDSA